MRIALPNGPRGTDIADRRLELTYCTNIHAADGWPAVLANLKRFAPALKRQLSPSGPFGLGLRLSARDARELLTGGSLECVSRMAGRRRPLRCPHQRLPLRTVPRNAGEGGGLRARLARIPRAWTTRCDLVRILQRLLPPGTDGGVSTAPLTYKDWMRHAGAGALDTMTRNVARVAAALVEARQNHGVEIHLDIEPEPDCLLETSGETIDFFEQHLLPLGGRMLQDSLGLTADGARAALTEHVQVCFDCCHFAVEFEDPDEALDRLHRAGLRIGRVQLSSALDVPLPPTGEATARIAERLRPFADTTYLHQVIERHGTELRHLPDLPDALAGARDAAGNDWRIHFHVPLFTADYDGLGSTQDYVGRVIDRAVQTPFTRHLEIETYTWDVLPGALKMDLAESIQREYEWVLARIGDAARPPGSPI